MNTSLPDAKYSHRYVCWSRFAFYTHRGYSWQQCEQDAACGIEAAKRLWASFLVYEAVEKLTS